MFLGVDGGGSKTAFVLLSSEGEVLAQHKTGGAYHLQIGMDGLESVLREGLDGVLKQAQITREQISYAFVGLPAYGEDSRMAPALDAVPKTVLGSIKFQCGNDMICGWAGSLACKDGINIVSGTGSIGYGEVGSQSARAGGWGELFSDEGSAYWLAVKGLNIFSKMSDGRIPKGPLYNLYRKAFNLQSDLDLSGFIMSEIAQNRDDVAALAKHVARAANIGDPVAIELYKNAAQELALIVTSVARQLPFKGLEPIMVSYSGGVFAAGDLIIEPLKAYLSLGAEQYVLEPPLHSPEIGAALYARKLFNAKLSNVSAHGTDLALG